MVWLLMCVTLAQNTPLSYNTEANVCIFVTAGVICQFILVLQMKILTSYMQGYCKTYLSKLQNWIHYFSCYTPKDSANLYHCVPFSVYVLRNKDQMFKSSLIWKIRKMWGKLKWFFILTMMLIPMSQQKGMIY